MFVYLLIYIYFKNRFSVECLLSFIEINQFQQYIINNLKDGEIDKEELEQLLIWQFPKNIPLSSIIPQTKHKKTNKNEAETEEDIVSIYKECALKLFNKYIKTGAQFEINISFVDRERLYNLLNDLNRLKELNMNTRDLLLLFEPSKRTMQKLLGFSLTRFKKKKEFHNVEQALTQSDMVKEQQSRFSISIQSV